MPAELCSAEVELKVEFYDVDALRVVWHGHYIKYLEKARCALMEALGFSYNEMAAAGFAWPIVSLHLKYVRPLQYNQRFTVRASLLEYAHRIRIAYRIIDQASGKTLNKAETIQMAYDLSAGAGLLISPLCLTQAVEAALARRGKDS
jgi:acyl-CoA thioester hydrolase